MSNAPSLIASASCIAKSPSPHFGQRRCEMFGTRISSPLTDIVTASRVLRIIVPHVGQASSGSSACRLGAAAPRFRLVFALILRLPVERDDNAGWQPSWHPGWAPSSYGESMHMVNGTQCTVSDPNGAELGSPGRQH